MYCSIILVCFDQGPRLRVGQGRQHFGFCGFGRVLAASCALGLALQAVGGFRFGGLGFDMCLGLFASQLSYNSHEEVPTLAAVETGV